MYELNDLEIEILNFINNNDSNRVINTAEIAGALNAKTDRNIAPAIYKTVPVLIGNKLLQCSKGEYNTITPLSLTKMGIKALKAANNPEKIPCWKRIGWFITRNISRSIIYITGTVVAAIIGIICGHYGSQIITFLSNLLSKIR